jgi:hypothetical protein
MTTSTLSGRDAATPCTVATDLFLDSIDAALEETPFVYTERVALGDDSKTTVHVLRQELRNTVVKVADLGSAKRVTDVCTESGGRVVAAMSGGFFAREAGMPLGELWIGGRRQSHVPFPAPWRDIRGSLLVDADGITIGRRDALPSRPDGDLLQAGPVLVTDGRANDGLATDGEGFGAASGQFDSDITDGRYPRAALAIAGERVLAVACDGRHDRDAGLTLAELADTLVGLGATSAINLDGGGSTTLICAGRMRNRPREEHGCDIPGGRAVSTALVFRQRR